MKTYEYIVHPGTQKAFTFMFDAESRVEADEFLKQRTKRGVKSEFVKTRPTNYRQGARKGLQHVPQRNHSTVESSKNWTHVFTCADCGHQWSKESAASHTFQELCPQCKKFWGTGADIEKQPKQEPITYETALFKHVQLPEFDMDGSRFMETGNWERPVNRSAS